MSWATFGAKPITWRCDGYGLNDRAFNLCELHQPRDTCHITPVLVLRFLLSFQTILRIPSFRYHNGSSLFTHQGETIRHRITP